MLTVSITPLESMASGRPVIAFKAGGALETVKNNVSGLFFDEQNVPSLKAAIIQNEKTKWNSKEIKKYAKKFDESVFEKEFKKYLLESYEKWIAKMA